MQSQSKFSSPAAAMEGRALCSLRAGENSRVLALGQQGSQLKNRLLSMGLRPGAPLRVLSRAENGPLVIAVCGARLILGPALAEHIYVR